MSSDAERSSGCLPTAFTLIAVGILVAVTGWFWNYPQLTYASGVIVESQPLRPPTVRRITYEYVAFGIRYRSQRVMRLSTQTQPFYEVGSVFPVYFVTVHPEKSYGPSPPIIQPLLWLGPFLAAFGGVIMYFAWPR